MRAILKRSTEIKANPTIQTVTFYGRVTLSSLPPEDDRPKCSSPINGARDKYGNLLKLGDHVRTPKYLGTYHHHGIFLADRSVIHYSGLAGDNSSGKIEIISIDAFAKSEDITVDRHPRRQFDPEETIRRALSRLHENDYSIFENNCEHFVNWCIEGESTSPQLIEVPAKFIFATIELKHVLPKLLMLLLSKGRPFPK